MKLYAVAVHTTSESSDHYVGLHFVEAKTPEEADEMGRWLELKDLSEFEDPEYLWVRGSTVKTVPVP